MAKPLIAVFSGPTATIQNSEPLVTSNVARAKYGLPPRMAEDGSPLRHDHLRAQRLAAPVTVYVEQFSAHPLERDAAELYAAPDGYLDANGTFHRERQSPADKPVYEVVLGPEDGLFMLPYMARQANGQAWDDDCAYPGAPGELCRQPFYPDASLQSAGKNVQRFYAFLHMSLAVIPATLTPSSSFFSDRSADKRWQ